MRPMARLKGTLTDMSLSMFGLKRPLNGMKPCFSSATLRAIRVREAHCFGFVTTYVRTLKGRRMIPCRPVMHKGSRKVQGTFSAALGLPADQQSYKQIRQVKYDMWPDLIFRTENNIYLRAQQTHCHWCQCRLRAMMMIMWFKDVPVKSKRPS